MLMSSIDIISYVCNTMNKNTNDNIRCLGNLSKTNKKIKEIIDTEINLSKFKEYRYYGSIATLIYYDIEIQYTYCLYNKVRSLEEYKRLEEYEQKIDKIIPHLTKTHLRYINKNICKLYLEWIECEYSFLRFKFYEEAKRLYKILQKVDRNYKLILNIPMDNIKLTQVGKDCLLDWIKEWVNEM